MNKQQVIRLSIAILLTAFLGVYAEIQQSYEDEAIQNRRNHERMFQEAEIQKQELIQESFENAAKAKMAKNDREHAEAALKDCQNDN